MDVGSALSVPMPPGNPSRTLSRNTFDLAHRWCQADQHTEGHTMAKFKHEWRASFSLFAHNTFGWKEGNRLYLPNNLKCPQRKKNRQIPVLLVFYLFWPAVPSDKSVRGCFDVLLRSEAVRHPRSWRIRPLSVHCGGRKAMIDSLGHGAI